MNAHQFAPHGLVLAILSLVAMGCGIGMALEFTGWGRVGGVLVLAAGIYVFWLVHALGRRNTGS